MTLRFRAGAASDVGRVRDHNEDGYLVDDGLGLVAVADGMGGHRAGEVASAAALDALRIAFGAGAAIGDAVSAANDIVFEQSVADRNLRGMGTTLTAGALGIDGTLLLGHVGDSRAYLLRDGSFDQVTTDHSLVAELIESGEITEEEAEQDPRRSMITRALGLEPGVDVDVETIDLQAGDRVMLCSDGLTTMVRDDDIAEILGNESDVTTAATRLVEAANEAGGVDNTTVVVIDIEEGDDPGDDEAPEEPVASSDEEAEPEIEIETSPTDPGPTEPADDGDANPKRGLKKLFGRGS
jgi:PPM family protein phosphatase